MLECLINLTPKIQGLLAIVILIREYRVIPFMGNQIMFRFILLLFIFAGSAYCNDAPIRSVGKTIQPLKDSPVRMVSEEVHIGINSEHAYVNCLFYLLNEGKPDTIEVGFPRGWEGDLINFFARTDKEILPIQTLAEEASYNEVSGGEMPWWKVFKVPFPAENPNVRIENHYLTYLNPGMGSGYPDLYNDRSFTYIMKTGAPWKGIIEEATVTLNHSDIPFEQITKISPPGFVRERRRIIWNFKNFEPTQNIEIEIMNDLLYERMVTAKKILEKDSDNALGHYFLGTFYYSHPMQSKKDAEKELKTAIALDPGLLDAKWFLAALYARYPIDMDKNNILKAIDELKEIIKINPEYFCNDRIFQLSPEFGSWQVKDVLSELEMNKEMHLKEKAEKDKNKVLK